MCQIQFSFHTQLSFQDITLFLHVSSLVISYTAFYTSTMQMLQLLLYDTFFHFNVQSTRQQQCTIMEEWLLWRMISLHFSPVLHPAILFLTQSTNSCKWTLTNLLVCIPTEHSRLKIYCKDITLQDALSTEQLGRTASCHPCYLSYIFYCDKVKQY